MTRSAQENAIKKAAAITCLILNIGNFPLTGGWDYESS
jgi:hypothetical protein